MLYLCVSFCFCGRHVVQAHCVTEDLLDRVIGRMAQNPAACLIIAGPLV